MAIIGTYIPVKGTSIKLVSLSGEVIQHIRNTDATGKALKCKVVTKKNGGIDKMVFSVDRRSNIPTFPGMQVEIYKDQAKLGTTYSNTIPQPGSEENILKITCLGYMHKLKESLVTKSYLAKDLDFVIADIAADMALVDVKYNVALIDLPTITNTSLDFKNKSLDTIIDTVMGVANFDYNNAEYRWFIDADRYLNIELIPTDAIKGLFEGFNYQNPKVDLDDSDIVNKLEAFSAGVGSTNDLSSEGVYEDTESQGKYGIKMEKFVFPDNTSSDVIGDICEGILARRKDPQTKIKLDNLIGIDFPFAFYNLSNRIDNYWVLLSECDSFENWDLSAAVNTTVTLDETTVLTGRRSIKCALAAGSVGESITLTPPVPVFAPKLFRMSMYLGDIFNFTITITDIAGGTVAFNLGSAELNLEVNDPITKNLEVFDGATTYNISVTIQISYTDQWLKIEVPLDIRALERVTLTFLEEAATEGYIDRLEVLSNSYNTNKLTLEKLTYNLDRDFAISSAEFGREFITLTDAIKKKVSDGDIMLSLATRQ